MKYMSGETSGNKFRFILYYRDSLETKILGGAA